MTVCDAGLKPILEKLFNLYMVSTIEKNLGNLLILGIVKPDQVSFHLEVIRHRTGDKILPLSLLSFIVLENCYKLMLSL